MKKHVANISRPPTKVRPVLEQGEPELRLVSSAPHPQPHIYTYTHIYVHIYIHTCI